MALPSLAHPGQLLGSSSKYIPGPGTHLQTTSIYASLAGRPMILPNPSSLSSSKSLSLSSTPIPSKSTIPQLQNSSSSLPVLTIPRILPPLTSPIPSISVSNTNSLPTVGSIVLCRVTRLAIRQVDVMILVVGDEVCGEAWKGVLRREDIRIGDKGESAAEGYRVGDLVRGKVVSPSFLAVRGGTGVEHGRRDITDILSVFRSVWEISQATI